MLLIERLATVATDVRGQPPGPGKIVGIDVVHAGFRIEGLAAPFSTAVESGKDDGLFVDAQRNELTVASKRSELVERPLVRLWRSSSQEIFCQSLPRERQRQRRQRLRVRDHLPWHITGR